jgi:hypothetical protein
MSSKRGIIEMKNAIKRVIFILKYDIMALMSNYSNFNRITHEGW